MEVQNFKQLIENMPEQITVQGEEKECSIHFDSDIEFESDEYEILTHFEGYQNMKYSSGEDEVGLADGWELNRDAPIEINKSENLHVWKNDRFIELTRIQEKRLYKAIVELIYLEL